MNKEEKRIIAQNRINELKKKIENFENDSKQLGKMIEALENQKNELIENLKNYVAENKSKSVN